MIQVPINKSRIVDLRSPVTRVSVANPAIADILVVNPEQIYVVGKQLGTTNMTLWDEDDRVKDMMGLEVTHDIQSLKEKMFHLLPRDKIGVSSSQGAIVLSGSVSSPTKLDAALKLAETYSPGTKVINLMQVGGAQQVMLEVRVAEISRNFLRKLDVNFQALYNGGSAKIGVVNGGAAILGEGALGAAAARLSPGFPVAAPGAGTIQDKGIFARFLDGNFFFNLALEAAKNQGLARILAEPNLTTLSGQEARFLAGGEFPVPSVSQNGTNVEYKDYGIGLGFVPLVLDSGLIGLKVDISVSEINPETSVVTSAGLAFGVTKRDATSSVEVPTGQTIAIAGLLSEQIRGNSSKFPGLGEVPVLGPLFRSQDFQKSQTELVIFVTPRLARSYSPELVTLPTDGFVEPSDTEFYLMGRLQGRKPGETSPSTNSGALGPDKSGSEGHFGHDL